MLRKVIPGLMQAEDIVALEYSHTSIWPNSVIRDAKLTSRDDQGQGPAGISMNG
jgi:hypothetical protein